jgi:2-methylcitrate dehydratase PrpD
MSGSSNNPHTRAIAQFISQIRYEAIPNEVIGRIKLLILDSLGCALYGSALEWSQILRATLARLDGTKACRVWGTPELLSAPHAVLVNGTLIQSFELDDVHRQGVLHVGAVTLPPLLAITELRRSLSGRDFLQSAVAGYEIGPRVGKCMGPQHIGQGWHSGATVGVFSAVSGAAAALRLSGAQAVHALGIAGTQSSGLMAAQYGAMVKRMHAGRAAQSGLYGALLAEAGFTGIVDVFESPYGGFCSTFSRSNDRFNLDELSWELGRVWETMRISLKFYSCVGSNHTTLDAIRSMQNKTPFGAGDIASIVVHGSQVTVEHVGWPYEPQGLVSAQLNLPFCVATLLLEGDVFVDQFTEEVVVDKRRIELSKKVSVVHDPSITGLGSNYRHMVHVEVQLKNGVKLKQTVEAPRGSENSFASEAEIVQKFKKLATHIVSDAKADDIVNLVLAAEKLERAEQIAQALANG